MTESDDDEEYCAKCGYSEFNEDGTRSHDDEEEYDHNFEYEEDDGPTLQDIDKGLDVLNKGINIWNKLTKKSVHPELDPNKFKIDTSKITPDNVMAHLGVAHATEQNRKKEQAKLDEQKIEKRHNETIKWTKIGIGVGAIVAVILGTVAIIFN